MTVIEIGHGWTRRAKARSREVTVGVGSAKRRMQPLESSQRHVGVLHHLEVGFVEGHTGPLQMANFYYLIGSPEGITASEVTFGEASRWVLMLPLSGPSPTTTRAPTPTMAPTTRAARHYI
jgi:hypothetical protein